MIVTTQQDALGIPEEEWDARVASCKALVERHATVGRQTVLTYSEVNLHVAADTDLAPFDFTTDLGRAQLGQMLGLVSAASQEERGVMLTAIVGYLDPLVGQLGGGFFDMAVKLHRLPAHPSLAQREAFWMAEVQRVFEVYGADRRRQRGQKA